MNDAIHFLPAHRRSGQVPSLVLLVVCLLVVCLLVGIRLTVSFVCFTCFIDLERPTSRSFHLHNGSDLNPCHHGRVEASPLLNWACAVNQDDSAFILPEAPRLPIIVSLFVPLFLLAVSYGDKPLIAAHGRGPPFSFS